jgi:hypothetical protein
MIQAGAGWLSSTWQASVAEFLNIDQFQGGANVSAL